MRTTTITATGAGRRDCAHRGTDAPKDRQRHPSPREHQQPRRTPGGVFCCTGVL